ncbi:hypothetical protein L2E82_13841 [Cichorium intybus]|uniref:Uncharacterized protein n=1 Tax=Cichorium intybus TaxID=13427 RepID=A0ACB9EYZ0_CICIN|nr:hypothetical protein L2E82_13841 [Cichorium intybus]
MQKNHRSFGNQNQQDWWRERRRFPFDDGGVPILRVRDGDLGELQPLASFHREEVYSSRSKGQLDGDLVLIWWDGSYREPSDGQAYPKPVNSNVDFKLQRLQR